jgi:hypothetical protein
VTGADIRLAAQNLLLFADPIPFVAPEGRNGLALALQQAEAGDASAFSPPVATGPSDDNANGSQIAIEPRPITVRHTPPILITNATHDPSTAYPWALQLHRDLRSSVLVTRAGDGHTSYLAHGVSHTRDAIDSYLATGQTPPPGTVYPD